MDGRRERMLVVLVAGLAGLIALAGTRDQASAWNDTSRLASVEALVDHGTWAIDDSTFAGTKDKLFIAGHYYSDKSPTPALYLASVYQLYEWLGGAPARADKPAFVWLMTFVSSGLAYIVAVLCIWLLGRTLGLPVGDRLVLTVSFALATVAVVYTRQVNNHIMFLGVAAALVLTLTQLVQGVRGWPTVLTAGVLTGIGYTIDLGVGPVLVVCTLALVFQQCRSWRSVALFALAALPWLALHHGLNYAIGGTWRPANANPEFFQWPGCPFKATQLTGAWNHENPLEFISYAVEMLVGNRGFLGHNLPLFLAAATPYLLRRRRFPGRPLMNWAIAWCVLSWLLYAATSNNYSGLCCSIRWFVPLLAPGYLILALLLRERPECRSDLIYLTIWGTLMAGVMWLYGPWMGKMVPLYWGWQAAALISYGVVCYWLRHSRSPWLAVRNWSIVKGHRGLTPPARLR